MGCVDGLWRGEGLAALTGRHLRLLVMMGVITGAVVVLLSLPRADASPEEYNAEITLEGLSHDGTSNMYQSEASLWDFTLKNTGSQGNDYTFVCQVYNETDVAMNSDWIIAFVAGNTVTLDGNDSGGQTTFTSRVSVTPVFDALPEVYQIELAVNGTNVSRSIRTNATIPLPDFVIEAGDVQFSHSAACVYGTESQEVTIFVTIHNHGGNRDATGQATNHIDVQISESEGLVDIDNSGNSTITLYIETIGHGQEETIIVNFTTIKAITPDRDHEKVIYFTIIVDELDDSNDPDIYESDPNNNDVTKPFTLVQYGNYCCGPWPITSSSMGEHITEIFGITLFHLNLLIITLFLGIIVIYIRHEIPHVKPIMNKCKDVERNGKQHSIKDIRQLPSRHRIVRVILCLFLLMFVTLGSVYFIDSKVSFVEFNYDNSLGYLHPDKIDNNTWVLQVFECSPSFPVKSVFFQLYSPSGNLVATGNIWDIYGTFLGYNRTIVYIDNDFNGKLSPGDLFNIRSGEPGDPDLESIDDLSGYKFRLMDRNVDKPIMDFVTLAE